MDEEARGQQDSRIQRTTANIDRKIVVMSGKGGVGKSTVAVNLAVALASKKNRVGLLDVDIHGPSIPRLLGLAGRRVTGDGEALLPIPFSAHLQVISIGNFLESTDSAVIWRGPRKNGMIRQFLSDVAWGHLDYLIVDSPPGTGDEPMAVIQNAHGSEAVIVTTPQEVSLDDVRKSISFCRSLDTPVLGLIENMSGLHCPHCGNTIDLFGAGGGERLSKEMKVPFLGRLPIDPQLVETGDAGRPYYIDHPDSPAGQALTAVVEKISRTEAAQPDRCCS